jgi:hypothetical protein
MIVAADGVGASDDAVNGKPHAGVLFQRSDTVGLLLSVIPKTHSGISAFTGAYL